MAGKGDGEGEGNILKLENQIAVIKYVMLFMNIIEWMIGACIFALCLWLRFEPGIQEWLQKLDALQFYIGIYVLIIAAVVIMIVSFVGCASALQESSFALLIYIGTQVLGFICGLAGSAVLLDNSARDSRFQPRIRESMRQLIMNAHNEESKRTLAMIQENATSRSQFLATALFSDIVVLISIFLYNISLIACCGADGANDFVALQQPLPSECRDTVTGNPFYHGCVDELTWFFEQKCAWIAGLAMTVCFLHVINVVLATVLIQALKKEEEQADSYRK